MSDISHILHAIDGGDPQAAELLLPLVYDELRRLAAAQMARENPGLTLDATALVHEAYLRLVGNHGENPRGSPGFDNRRHFFAAAAEAMRRILIEQARRKQSLKRGGDRARVSLDAVAAPERETDDVIDLDMALSRFAADQPARAEFVKLRYFVGLSLDEAAATLGISPATADRWWAYAKAWLRFEINHQRNSVENR